MSETRARRPEDHIADRTRPYTGAEYMASLRDGREVYINGERVKDVTTHPALRNSVRSIATPNCSITSTQLSLLCRLLHSVKSSSVTCQ